MYSFVQSAKTGGTELWSEVQSVTVNQGVYSVALGSVTQFSPSLDFNSTYYLQVEIDDGAGGWELFSTRQKLTYVPYAINADTVDGMDATALDQSAHLSDTNNPHNVTASQAGADPAGSAAAVQNNLDTHAADPAAHHTKTTSFTELTDSISDSQIPTSITRDTELAALQATVDAQAVLISTLQAQVAALQDLLQHFSRTGNDIYITGANLHILNGTGTTYGPVNGLGNLIVGYNELRGTGDDRTGSHNIVVGGRHNYLSYGGLVVGYYNTISGPYSSVSGGSYNSAEGKYSSLSGGENNIASGTSSSVSGGAGNTASGPKSSVCGGRDNTANGWDSSISGGWRNTASGADSSICGGSYNTASGTSSSVSGGTENTAFAHYSSVSGGYFNLTGDGTCNLQGAAYKCTPGSDQNVGLYSTITGGNGNRTAGIYASATGGAINTVSGEGSSVSGGIFNTASNRYSSVSGGSNNTASGEESSISGGIGNIASGLASSVSGGESNTASGGFSSVSGGISNTVSGNYEFSNKIIEVQSNKILMAPNSSKYVSASCPSGYRPIATFWDHAQNLNGGRMAQVHLFTNWNGTIGIRNDSNEYIKGWVSVQCANIE